MKSGLQKEVQRITLTTATGDVVYETVNYPMGSEEFQHSTINDLLGEISTVTHTSRAASNVAVLEMKHEIFPVDNQENALISVKISEMYPHALLFMINRLLAAGEGEVFSQLHDERLLVMMLKTIKRPFVLQPNGAAINWMPALYTVGEHSHDDLHVTVARAALAELCDDRYPGAVRIPKFLYDANIQESDQHTLKVQQMHASYLTK